ncbi:MAG: tRNA (guanine-N(1)-)-methyltransferase [Candidatus Woesebacteria bacterium GW2011_GWB1_41_10]|uniref:tRNA (guanine-N(1)-)-methyltransferase n=1 Tax=Candidatus Woesebacteria bacterium GW2011_GWB1_41_10 TaxID=1618577 RepID=A0A0G0U5Q7_9BACT|nr:MAG: tRNA (guanine-N(1)-)-methyltransferase [Candidatus Woesebacteria bacterium GW2011_GWB1_41_10]
MKIDILTLFPKMFEGPFAESILQRAQDKNLVEIKIHDLRAWGLTGRRTVDDRPYGGGVGMLLRVDVIDKAISKVKGQKSKVVLLDASGERYTQAKAKEFSKLEHLILIAGHYEGVDHRVTGGEIPAMVITDSIVRLIPRVLSKKEATKIESFSEPGKVEFPQYTRPEEYKKWKVPEVLLSGNHKEIEKWRKNK